jgi:hypothetical protein
LMRINVGGIWFCSGTGIVGGWNGGGRIKSSRNLVVSFHGKRFVNSVGMKKKHRDSGESGSSWDTNPDTA